MFLYFICWLIPQTPLYRNNFSVENTAVVLDWVGSDYNSTVIGTLKMRGGGYYLEVTDIPDYYFNEDGKMLIKVTRRGYEKPQLWDSRMGLYDRTDTTKIETTDYRLCTKDEVIELIDEGYESNLEILKEFKDREEILYDKEWITKEEYLKRYRYRIDFYRFGKDYSHPYYKEGPLSTVIIFPKGKKPFFNFFTNMRLSEVKRGYFAIGTHVSSREDDVMPGFNFIAPHFKSYYGRGMDLDYNLNLPKAEPCFTPYKVKVWDYHGMTEKAKEYERKRKENIINKNKKGKEAWNEERQNEYKKVY
jgi:hypothetical protein